MFARSRCKCTENIINGIDETFSNAKMFSAKPANGLFSITGR